MFIRRQLIAEPDSPASTLYSTIPNRLTKRTMETLGSTSTIEPVCRGVVLKQPITFQDDELAKMVDVCFSVEPLILQRLGQHPRIVKYLGQQGRGILLGKASHSNLQAYLDSSLPSIHLHQRIIWCRQLAEAISYIHSRGVVHSDLRPRNVLVHETIAGSRDLLLCDFGGSTCDELGLDGGCLPDGPFYHPTFKTSSTPALDIFGLGSLFFTIMTGHWPYRSTPGAPETIEEKLAYERELADAFNNENYPDVTRLVGGNVILACWKRQYSTADEVLRALDKEVDVSVVEPPGAKDIGHVSKPFLGGILVAALVSSVFVLVRQQRR
ncbi:Protein kinase-like domain [Cordyceps militaris CM01]|uniref:EKC/KEOPS complex subunit BUD32 n=1 Tax=Cordyceps militaris (strain CM01) TaxID=983644 RepID=G3JPD1_CORMM|nr:Protein kinase-like domain [Cordyceps militaris CM01]EGX89741.1 Protein kinase-like domain [Cordyceps militaris CM01]